MLTSQSEKQFSIYKANIKCDIRMYDRLHYIMDSGGFIPGGDNKSGNVYSVTNQKASFDRNGALHVLTVLHWTVSRQCSAASTHCRTIGHFHKRGCPLKHMTHALKTEDLFLVEATRFLIP